MQFWLEWRCDRLSIIFVLFLVMKTQVIQSERCSTNKPLSKHSKINVPLLLPPHNAMALSSRLNARFWSQYLNRPFPKSDRSLSRCDFDCEQSGSLYEQKLLKNNFNFSKAFSAKNILLEKEKEGRRKKRQKRVLNWEVS